MNENRVLSKDKWAEEAWGTAGAPGDRTVDFAVAKIRRKLREALPGWEFIHTHFGVGYRFSAQRLQDVHSSDTRS